MNFPKPSNTGEEAQPFHPQGCSAAASNSCNNVHSEAFESKMDHYFTDKAKTKDHWTRQSSIKIEGKWT